MWPTVPASCEAYSLRERKRMPVHYSITEKELAKAFTEWDRRYRKEPERFESEAVRLLRSSPRSYGESCAPYLLALLDGTV